MPAYCYKTAPVHWTDWSMGGWWSLPAQTETLTRSMQLAPTSSHWHQGQWKSKLIHVLEKLTTRWTTEAYQQSDEDPIETDADPPDHRRKIAVVDGMVLVQKMTTKPVTVVTVMDLSVFFNDRLMNLTRSFGEAIVVLNTYKADSLKSTTRQKRRKGKDPVQYQVRDETSIRHITMSRFLSHVQTKADLTEYLAEKTLDYIKDSSKVVITSAAGHTRSN